jgi:hypothetical protein
LAKRRNDKKPNYFYSYDAVLISEYVTRELHLAQNALRQENRLQDSRKNTPSASINRRASHLLE